MSTGAPERAPGASVDPLDRPRDTRLSHVAAREAAAFEALLRERQAERDAGLATPEIGRAAATGPVAETRLSLGMMRLTLSDLIARLEAMPEPSRETRAGLWALRAEARKLAVLDGYINGLIRG